MTHVLQVMRACAPRTALRALAWYTGITVAFTWPVVAGLTRDVPRDLGDSLLNCWIIGWNAKHFLDAAGGDLAGLATLWHGNIFHPEPYALAYSELLVTQSVQAVPIYAATSNLVLCYNLLFLSTFVLSALGMYVLVRGYTDDWRVAFVGGLLYGFAPYRALQATHLQVMSSQWMPFALHGLHRFIATRRLRALIGGASALIAQNLSCGYYLVFFSLFVPPFVLFEIHRSRAWRDRRVWAGLAGAVVLVGAATLPFMRPYLALRDLRGTERSRQEIEFFSADTWSWITADAQLAVWGPRLRTFVRPEGELFPGVVPLALVAVAAVAGTRRAWRATRRHPSSRPAHAPPRALRRLVRVALATATLAVGAALLVVSGYVFVSLSLVLAAAAASMLVIVLLSGRARAMARAGLVSPLGFSLVALLVAWYLSLGPVPKAGGQPLGGPALYGLLLDWLPGFDGLRVAARFAMLCVLFLSFAAAWGVGTLVTSVPRRSQAFVAGAIAVVLLLEAWVAPLPVNGQLPSNVPGVHASPARVASGHRVPATMRFLRELPQGTVLLEMPFGLLGWETQYVYYSTLHWRPLVNGFSGYAPDSYRHRVEALRDPYADPDAAFAAVVDSGATHVVVHGRAYDTRRPPAPHDWLLAHGARHLRQIGTDDIYEIRR